MGGSLIANGRRRIIIIFNILAILSSLLSLILDFKVLCMARFLFGFSSGVILCATPKNIEETIPSKLLDYGFGISTNISINIAIMYSMLLGLGEPKEELDLEQSGFWRIIYGI